MRRLLSTTDDPYETALLRAGRNDRPPTDHVRKTAAAIAGAAVLTTTACTAGAAAGKAALSAAATKSLATMIAPWIVVGTVATGAVLGIATVIHQPSNVELPGASVTAPKSARAKAPVQPVTRADDLPSASAVEPPRIAPAREEVRQEVVPSAPSNVEATSAASSSSSSIEPQSAPPPVSASQSSGSASALTAEIRAIDAARRALAAGRARDAMSLLDQYSRDFPRGALSLEAEVMMIEACARSSDQVRSVHLAKRFLASHPNDPHAARVRQFLSKVTNP